jgi:hypothetical protein
MSNNDGAGPITMFAQLIADTYTSAVAVHRWREKRRLEKQLAQLQRQLNEQEKQSRERQRLWRAEVERQMADGQAGNASQEDATAGLSGSGGRRSELDDRWFP